MLTSLKAAVTALMIVVVTVPAVAQDRWVGKTVTLRDYQGYCYDLSDAALHAAVTDMDATHLLNFITPPGTQVKILESSYHGISPGDKFYRAKVLTGDRRGEVGWFDGFWMNNSRPGLPGKAPPSIDPKPTYPKAGGY